MNIVIRVDGDGRIGGGHVMRCLALANEARSRGHGVWFVMAMGPDAMVSRVQAEGFDVFTIPPDVTPDPGPEDPVHAKWLMAPVEQDAARTAEVLTHTGADWLIYDHYGLDGRWVAAITAQRPSLRVMAIDDLDDRALAADVVLDQTRIDPPTRQFPTPSAMVGPHFALLRPEFARLRAAMPQRAGGVHRVLVAPGMMDAAGLAPMAILALSQLSSPPTHIDIVMGSQSQSRSAVEVLAAADPRITLHLDTPRMAELMMQADLCIGAGGMTSWERCALALGAVIVVVADNQRAAVADLVTKGAAVAISLADCADTARFASVIAQASLQIEGMAQAAAGLCDGRGAARVVDVIEARFEPMTVEDAEMVFAWRNRPDVRAASLNQAPLIWEDHRNWVARLAERRDGIWAIYFEGARPLGSVSATTDGNGTWHWGFYIGAQDAPRGAGGRMLAAFHRQMRARKDVTRITADVRATNGASIRLHQKLGFTQSAEAEPGILRFEWSI